ncbi:hypothetical protein NDU88_001373 [Pleurodeles waltl]|uniref:Uncharacterized protein n=1 Tax=Pleurodeles waltl TaxID=8319 RepID=A0AAV7S9Y1_PLEWA|nr:hypothetical protein NDU88_001373 [Pleurodeles waltl]
MGRNPVPGGGIRAATKHPCEQDTDPEHAASAVRKADSEKRHQRKGSVTPKKTQKHTHQTGHNRTGQKRNTKREHNCPTEHILPGERTGTRKRRNYREK